MKLNLLRINFAKLDVFPHYIQRICVETSYALFPVQKKKKEALGICSFILALVQINSQLKIIKDTLETFIMCHHFQLLDNK